MLTTDAARRCHGCQLAVKQCPQAGLPHTSDRHLGRTFHGRVLDDAHAAFADHLVELVAAESVNVVKILFRRR